MLYLRTDPTVKNDSRNMFTFLFTNHLLFVFTCIVVCISIFNIPHLEAVFICVSKDVGTVVQLVAAASQ